MKSPTPSIAAARLPVWAGSRRSRQRGFTAIEIAMVATVIAIFALIVLPLFRNRVDEAKLAAARADLTSMMKAEILAQADTSFYFRLEDLDNQAGNNTGTPPVAGITLETPPIVFPPLSSYGTYRVLTTAEWVNLNGPPTAPKFRGPYITFQNHITYQELKARPDYSQLANAGTFPAFPVRPNGIYDIPGASPNLFDSEENRIPVDPWGNPYLFSPSATETGFQASMIYSLGPDGLPGDGNVDPNAYRRNGVLTNGLGTGNDLKVQF